MIIADSSIWIEALRAKNNYLDALEELALEHNLLILEPLLAELVQGAKSKAEIDDILCFWDALPHINEGHIWVEAGINSFNYKWKNKGVGIIDAFVITVAWKYNYKIWTLDKKLAEAAGRAYVFSS